MAFFRSSEQSRRLPSPAAAADLFGYTLRNHAHEHLLLACLDDDMRMLGLFMLGSDMSNSVTGSLRDIVVEILASRATCVILAHNHPSGDIRPSQTDINTTRSLMRILHPLSIRLQDHLILSGDRWSSMRGLGLL